MYDSLCLDIGTKTGWCLIGDDESQIMGGVWDFSKLKPWERQPALAEELHNMFMHRVPEARYMPYEDVWKHRSNRDAHLYGSLKFAAIAEACNHGVKPIPIPWPAVKKEAGSGSFKKSDMIVAASVRWPGMRFMDDNHVDAAFIAAYWNKQRKATNGEYAGTRKSTKKRKPRTKVKRTA
jgi:hypothetical protein